MSHDEDDWTDINLRFYAASPADYFKQRLNLATELAAQTEMWGEMMRGGLRCGALTINSPPSGPRPPIVIPAKELAPYVAIEVEMIRHHVAEVLVTMYYVHENSQSCPWLGVASLRTPGQLKDALRRRFAHTPAIDQATARRNLRLLLLGGEAPVAGSERTDVEWGQAAENLNAFLLMAVNDYMGSAAYNAAKHGLALGTDQATIHLGGPGERINAGSSGLAFHYLEPHDDREKLEREWWLRTEMIDLGRSMFLAFIYTTMLDALWSLARQRYGLITKATVWVPFNVSLSDLEALPSPGSVTSFATSVATTPMKRKKRRN